MSWSKKEIPTSQFCNVFNRGVVKKTAQNSTKFSQYLCFNIIIGSNDLCAEQKYTEQQQRNHDLIKSLHDGVWDTGRLQIISTNKASRLREETLGRTPKCSLSSRNIVKD